MFNPKNKSSQPPKQKNPTMQTNHIAAPNPRRHFTNNTILTNNNMHLIQHLNRYPHLIWKSYIDTNPWTFATPTAITQPKPPLELPLPPDPSHYLWRSRCYNCLNLGHEQNTCTHQERTCAKCWNTDHEARVCIFSPTAKLPLFNLLMPMGNLGDAIMSKNRPKRVMVFIPETNQIQQDTCDMLRAVVIDTRLRDHHNLQILQSILMATCATPYPYPISKINGQQYLLLLPLGIDRETFISAHAGHLKETGYIAFPWRKSVNGTPCQLKFKVWVVLQGMSPCSYTIEHLLRAADSFGIVLEQAPWRVYLHWKK